MNGEWKPGDLAMRKPARHLGYDGDCEYMSLATTCHLPAHHGQGLHWHHVGGGWDPLIVEDGPTYRPLVVIDPESLTDGVTAETAADIVFAQATQLEREEPTATKSIAVLHAIAKAIDDVLTPPVPQEPTNPTARVTDRCDNIWRLLADGEWVCTSGPDSGEYLAWSGLVGRGPLGVEIP